MKLVKLVSKKAPKLKLHRYIVAVHDIHVTKAKGKKKAKASSYHVKYHYPANRLELRSIQKNLKRGQLIDIFRAEHKFDSSWGKGI